jgi:hypothetical protein
MNLIVIRNKLTCMAKIFSKEGKEKKEKRKKKKKKKKINKK